MNFETITFELNSDVGTIWLNRPDIRNAFNEVMIQELIDCYEEAGKMDEVRVLVLRGKGKAFCAGADLNWMRGVAGYTYEQNYAESLNLSKCFYTIYTSPKPTIALVHGAAIGGANGLLAACDFAYADHDTVFSLSEVKIGIVPACISPYVVKRTGEFVSRELMLTGRRFNGPEAQAYRLVNRSLDAGEMDAHLSDLVHMLRTSGPRAISQCKDLLFKVSNTMDLDEAYEYTARMIAAIRASEEGQEGMAAFLEKRLPAWVKPSLPSN
ncbi:MAG TPA: enoyl-CoA hydratase-related protein [Bacteroidales bacterium]|nr:enoyl-CoA hydratase-related protein [Bacteroidales bacterium]